MSKLEELIAELCPDGVEFAPLDECVIKTKNIRWIDNQEDIFSYIDLTSVDRDTHKINETQNINYKTAPSRAQQIVQTGDIILGATRPMLKRYCMIDDEYDGQICSTGFCVLRANVDKVLQKWILHQIASNSFFAHVEKFQKGASYPAISDADVKSFKIPIPPLPVQREIVRILDNFTELTAGLTAELTARKKQYEYYRDTLLTFGGNIEWKALNDIVEFRNGKGHEKAIVADGKYVVVNSKFISTNGEVKKYSNEQISPLFANDILMVMSDLPNGRALAKCYLVSEDGKYTLNQRIGALKNKEEKAMDTKYLFYVLNRNRQLLKYDNSVDQTNLKKDDILNIQIPVPPLSKQEHIVAILDRFDSLVNNITCGLPAEIEARRKQYEYYCDKLLTFKEKVS